MDRCILNHAIDLNNDISILESQKHIALLHSDTALLTDILSKIADLKIEILNMIPSECVSDLDFLSRNRHLIDVYLKQKK